MKKINLFIVLVLFVGAFSLMAQQVSYTVKTSSKCTNLKAEFSVPANKTANLLGLDVVPSFTSCNSSSQDLTTIVVYVKNKVVEDAKNKPTVLYKKTLEKSGLVTESVVASTVKLLTGTYILEVSSSAGTEATLNLQLFDN